MAVVLGILWARSEQEVIGKRAVEAARTLAETLDQQAGAVLAIMATLTADYSPDDDPKDFEENARRISAAVFGTPVEGQAPLEAVLRDQTGARIEGSTEPPQDRQAWQGALSLVRTDRQPDVTDLVETSAGRFIGVAAPVGADGRALVLQIPIDRLAPFVGQFSADWIIAVFDSQGMTLARSRKPEEFVGGRGREDLVAAVQAQEVGVMENISRDGIPLYNAFERCQFTDWSVIVGVPRSALVGPYWRAAILVFGTGIVLVLLGGGVAVVVQRRLQRNVRLLAAGAARMGLAPDFSVPKLEISELDEVGIAMANASERQRLLIGEMNHRVKNLLTLAGSVVALSASRATDTATFAQDSQRRIAALSRAHALTLPGEFDGTRNQERASLHGLIGTIVEPYEGGACQRVTIEGDDVAVNRRSLSALALLLHEFATNAAKYGSLSVPDGRVRIASSLENRALVLIWEETNGPVLPEAPAHEGFGTLLAQGTVTSQLGGELTREWLDTGLRIALTIPREFVNPT